MHNTNGDVELRNIRRKNICFPGFCAESKTKLLRLSSVSGMLWVCSYILSFSQPQVLIKRFLYKQVYLDADVYDFRVKAKSLLCKEFALWRYCHHFCKLWTVYLFWEFIVTFKKTEFIPYKLVMCCFRVGYRGI